jgi:membrane-bound lytic murein transglycosylase D
MTNTKSLIFPMKHFFILLLCLTTSLSLPANTQENEEVFKTQLSDDEDENVEALEVGTTDVDGKVIPEEAYEISSVEAVTIPLPAILTDAEYKARLKKLPSVIDLPYNNIVRNYIILYTDKIKEKSENILGLSEYYFPIFEEILDQYGLPLEFKYLPVIESALNPRAVSRAGATGLWQFMYSTAKLYGVTMTSTVDDRRDPIASTHLAARHLKDLYNIFNDWTMVLAAYNCGSGNVKKAIRRSGRDDFWGIYNYLPRETRGYVPAFIGATYMCAYHKEHRLEPTKYNFKKYYDYDTIQVTEWMHFDQIAKVVGISVETLRELNPQYRRDIIPGNEKNFTLKLPNKYIANFIDNESKIVQYKASTYNPKTMAAPAAFTPYVPSGKTKLVHHVRNGEVLSTIAERYGVRVQDIRNWNAIRDSRIYVGQKLSIYVSPSKAQLHSKQNATAYTKTSSSPSRQVTHQDGYILHEVKPGDTLWSISQQYKYLGITDDDIRKLNNISNTRRLMPGQIIRVKKVG